MPPTLPSYNAGDSGRAPVAAQGGKNAIFASLRTLRGGDGASETLLPAALGNAYGPLPHEQDLNTFAGCLSLALRVGEDIVTASTRTFVDEDASVCGEGGEIDLEEEEEDVSDDDDSLLEHDDDAAGARHGVSLGEARETELRQQRKGSRPKWSRRDSIASTLLRYAPKQGPAAYSCSDRRPAPDPWNLSPTLQAALAPPPSLTPPRLQPCSLPLPAPPPPPWTDAIPQQPKMCMPLAHTRILTRALELLRDMLHHGSLSFHGDYGVLIIWSLPAWGATGGHGAEPVLCPQMLSLQNFHEEIVARRGQGSSSSSSSDAYHRYMLADPEGYNLTTLPRVPLGCFSLLLTKLQDELKRLAKETNKTAQMFSVAFQKARSAALCAAADDAAAREHGAKDTTSDSQISPPPCAPHQFLLPGVIVTALEAQSQRVRRLANRYLDGELQSQLDLATEHADYIDYSSPGAPITRGTARNAAPTARGKTPRPTAAPLADALLVFLLRCAARQEAVSTGDATAVPPAAEEQHGDPSPALRGPLDSKEAAWAAVGRSQTHAPTSCDQDHDKCCCDTAACSGHAVSCGASPEIIYRLFAAMRSLAQAAGLVRSLDIGSGNTAPAALTGHALLDTIDTVDFLLQDVYARAGALLRDPSLRSSALRSSITETVVPCCKDVRRVLEPAVDAHFEAAAAQVCLLPVPLDSDGAASGEAHLFGQEIALPHAAKTCTTLSVSTSSYSGFDVAALLSAANLCRGYLDPSSPAASGLAGVDALLRWLKGLEAKGSNISLSCAFAAVEAIDVFLWTEAEQLLREEADFQDPMVRVPRP